MVLFINSSRTVVFPILIHFGVNQNIKSYYKSSLEISLTLNPLIRICPCAFFAIWLNLTFGQFTYPLSRYSFIHEKKIQKILPWKKLGIGFARKIRFRKIPAKYFSELSLTMTYFIATSTCIASNSTLFTEKCDSKFP